ncbi:MAG: alpha-xylosidase, partial [Bacteroidota bacterium]|nr:alpha-xylosidase [Bacteroidota bacterium]
MKKLLLSAIGFLLITLSLSAQELISLEGTAATVRLQDGKIMTVDFYGPDIVRVFLDPAGGPVRDPQATPPAKILVNNPRRDAGDLLSMPFGDDAVWINSDDIDLVISADGSFRFRHHIPAMRTMDPYQDIWRQARVEFTPTGTTLTLPGNEVADYYGGGIQNGRYRHNGKTIAIENQNSWTDGGVCSPAPWFWCTDGYGILWHTFAKGSYRFGEEVVLKHDTPYLDIFLMLATDPLQYPSVLELIPGATMRGFLEPSGGVLAELPAKMLKLYYQLTGQPVLLPKFGFYEGHLNAYNRDYWKETTEEGKGIPFEDGKRYVESQKDNGGIRESLNGELPGNYQFSARAVIDRYEAADMPLGWILPNDGYGAGYGQTGTLAGNVQNLKEFGDYARSKGVEIGLWTQSDLHPIDTIPALLQRDILAEVRDAGVRVLKTDVAWVGWGYSFGLNGITDAAEIMTKYGADARPFIITLDGWAGTQRYAGVWSGDQVGGNWEYIRFHIPTYLCAGLSGQPNITSDMDGIFGGKNEAVNIRDFQWKTFTPMQLNMDGWGSNEKYPQALGTRAADINRRYLKLKSELMPYTYSIAREAVSGDP